MMDAKAEKRIRELLSDLQWKKASSAKYADAPHEYIIREWCSHEWEELAGIVKQCGVVRRWRGTSCQYLFHDGLIYWVDWPALNRTDQAALENDGYPTPQSQARIQDRFGARREGC